MSNNETAAAPARKNVSREDFVIACMQAQCLSEVAESLGLQITSAQQRYHKLRKEGVAIPDRPLNAKANHVESLNELIERLQAEQANTANEDSGGEPSVKEEEKEQAGG